MFFINTKPFTKSHISARIYLTFLENFPKKLEMLLIPNFDISEKVRKAVIK